LIWAQFVLCLVIILVAGTRLSKYGDIIAEKTGLGRVWVGIVLLATVTSLPEVATGISAVTIVNSPDLAIGDLFGACMINLAIIALADVVYKKGPILHYLDTGIILAVILSMLLTSAAAASIFLAHNVFSISILGLVGIYSPALFCLYLISQYVLFRYKSRQPNLDADASSRTTDYSSISLKKTLIGFGIAALAIAGSGLWLGIIGDKIAHFTGLQASFVGTLFLAISTTAPEMAVSISAAKMGALEMSVANIAGSNLFNMGVIIFVNDLFFKGEPILKFVSTGHVVTALFTLMMSSVVIIGIIFRPKLWRKSWVGIDTTFIAILYAGALLALFFFNR
jgi:cation:H+ antiporter